MLLSRLVALHRWCALGGRAAARAGPRAHRLDVAEHHRDAVRARPRDRVVAVSRYLPLPGAGRRASESRHVPAARCRADCPAPAGPGDRPPEPERRRRGSSATLRIPFVDGRAGRARRACSRRFAPSAGRRECRDRAGALVADAAGAARPRPRRRRGAAAAAGAAHRRPSPGHADGSHRRRPQLLSERSRRRWPAASTCSPRRLPEYPRISMETVIRLAPDVIIDAGDMGDTPEERRARQALHGRAVEAAAARRRAGGPRPCRHQRRVRRAGSEGRRSD